MYTIWFHCYKMKPIFILYGTKIYSNKTEKSGWWTQGVGGNEVQRGSKKVMKMVFCLVCSDGFTDVITDNTHWITCFKQMWFILHKLFLNEVDKKKRWTMQKPRSVSNDMINCEALCPTRQDMLWLISVLRSFKAIIVINQHTLFEFLLYVKNICRAPTGKNTAQFLNTEINTA